MMKGMGSEESLSTAMREDASETLCPLLWYNETSKGGSMSDLDDLANAGSYGYQSLSTPSPYPTRYYEQQQQPADPPPVTYQPVATYTPRPTAA